MTFRHHAASQLSREVLVRFSVLLCATLLALATTPRALAAIVADGRLDEPEWQQAQRFDDFATTEPYTLDAPRHGTQAYVIGLPEGIAVGFRCEHPSGTRRIKSITPRDAFNPGDRVNLYIDLDADAKVAYNFMVTLSGAIQDGTLTNENQFSTDWDSEWEHGVHDDGEWWSAEMLIPWSVASMAGSDTPRRTVSLLFDRVIGAYSERSASPAKSYSQSRYLSEFRRVDIDQYRASVFHVFPYATAQYDFIDDDPTLKFGGDIFWKPSGDFQLTAAINPDFGQVESDELVVNFDAIETFFTDKRPFFTENQGVFDVRTPDSGLLIYTRRIGGPRDDDGDVAAEIDAAAKVNGRVGGLDYGVLLASERDYADDIGSAFYAQRLVHAGDELTVGYLGTWVDRPFLDRTAIVNVVDFTWRPDAKWLLSGMALASDIDDPLDDGSGTGAWLRGFYNPSPEWQHELELTHFDRTLDFNDMGFQRRASLNELEYTITRRFTDFGADDPRGSSSWSFEPQVRTNDAGESLPSAFIVVRNGQQKSGATMVSELIWQTRGIDDLISRGNGDVVLDPRLVSFFQNWQSPRLGKWRVLVGSWLFQEGNDDFAWQPETTIEYFARDNLTFSWYLNPRWSRDWLIWQEGDLLATYRREQIASGINVDFFPATDHELRLKLQWLAIDAHDGSPRRIGAGGVLYDDGTPIDDFSINNFGLQVRYRWTFAPQSDLYVVYSRGGFEQLDADDRTGGTGDLLQDAFTLRDADQFLVKVRYRF
jgi:hypothetical protein